MTPNFYIHEQDPSHGEKNRFCLRLKTIDLPTSLGSQVATFNTHTVFQHPGLMQWVVDTLNRAVEAEEHFEKYSNRKY